jgi:predicted alpha/beta-fold hydrolase
MPRAPWWQPGGHVQTLAPRVLDRVEPPPVDEVLVVPVAPESAVRVTVSQPATAARGTLALFHGLAGSAGSRAVVHTALEAHARGWAVARVDLRTCGGTAHLSATLYNAAQSGDVAAVLAALEDDGYPQPFAIVGFSLGGNLVLRYAALEGVASRAAAIAAVSPPTDLSASARTLEEPGLTPYNLSFTAGLCRLVRGVREVRPVPGPPADLWHIRSLRAFDAAFVVPQGGWRDVEDYYADASAGPLLEGARVPTLILGAANDPIVRPAMYRGLNSSSVRIALARDGGHVGFWSNGSRPSRFWAASAVLDFLEDATGR